MADVIMLFDQLAFTTGQLDAAAAEAMDANPFTKPADRRAYEAGWRFMKRPSTRVERWTRTQRQYAQMRSSGEWPK